MAGPELLQGTSERTLGGRAPASRGVCLMGGEHSTLPDPVIRLLVTLRMMATRLPRQ